MAITYPLSLPLEPGFAGIEIFKNSTVGLTRSPYDAAEQVQVYTGQYWEANITLPSLNTARSPAWEAFIGKLNGRQGTFLLSDPIRKISRGLAEEGLIRDEYGQYLIDEYGDYIVGEDDVPVIDGAHVIRSQELAVSGVRPDLDGWLLAGDYIQLGTGASTRLHQILEDADTDENGDTTLVVWPKTRAALSGGEAVIYTNCKGLFRMAQNRQGIARRPGPMTDYSFACGEAF